MRNWTKMGARMAAVLLCMAASALLFAQSEQREERRIEPEDVLEFRVNDQFGSEAGVNIVQQAMVGVDGRVSVPFLGTWPAEGKTPKQLIDEIKPELEKAVRTRDLLVSVSIIAYRKMFASVNGAVARSGKYEIRPDETVLSLLAQGGGVLLESRADLQKVTLRRKNTIENIPINLQAIFDGDTSQNYPIKDGDILFVPEADRLDKVLVWGKVRVPGPVIWTPGMRVMDALAASGGEIPNQSKFSKVLVIRPMENQPGQYLRIECNIVDFIRKGDAAQNIELQKRDIVFVPDTGNLNLDQINQVLGVFFILERFGINILRF